MMDFFSYDFDYAWPWTYGHLIAASLCRTCAWHYWLTGRADDPGGRALDMGAVWGVYRPRPARSAARWRCHRTFLPPVRSRARCRCGLGRSTLMVLLSRPARRRRARSIHRLLRHRRQHTGSAAANARAAGVDSGSSQVGDMREMPLKTLVRWRRSVAAIDHLNVRRERTWRSDTSAAPGGSVPVDGRQPRHLDQDRDAVSAWTRLLRRARVSGALAVTTLGRWPGGRGGRHTARVALLSESEGESVPSRKREDVHRAPFGHLRVLTWKEAIESVVHASRITAPAAVHGEVLLAVDREG